MRFRGSLAMDDYLATLGLWRKPTARDRTSLFRAVSEQLFHTQCLHQRLKSVCTEYVGRNRASLEEECKSHGQLDIVALSNLFRRDLLIYREVGKSPVNLTQKGYNAPKLVLCFSDGHHYDSIYPRTYIESAAICQSISYELLYKDVFGMDTPVQKGQEMITTKPYKPRPDVTVSTSPDSICPPSLRDPWDHIHSDIDSLDYKEVLANKERLGHKIVPFPYKVAKALAPDIYRNVELDAWIEAKKDLSLNGEVDETEPTFAPGDKCQVTLEGYPDKVFNAHIQEIVPEHGPTTVFVEELGEKHKVPLANLRTIPQSAKQAWHSVEDGQAGYRKRKSKKKDFHMVIGFNSNLPPRMQQQLSEDTRDQGPPSPAASGRPRSYSEGAATSGSPVPNNNDYGAGCPGAESGEMIAPRTGHTPPQPEPKLDHRPDSYGSAACVPVHSMKMVQEMPPMQAPQPLQAPAGPVPVYHVNQVPVVNPESPSIVNFGANPSCDLNGHDLPYHDIPTLRYFFNLGIEYYRLSYCMPVQHPVTQHQQHHVQPAPVQYQMYQQPNGQVTYNHMVPTYHVTQMANGDVIQQPQMSPVEEDYPGQSTDGDTKIVKDHNTLYPKAAAGKVAVPYVISMAPPAGFVYQKPSIRVPLTGSVANHSKPTIVTEADNQASSKHEVVSIHGDKSKHDESTDSCDCPSDDNDKLCVTDSGCVSDASSGHGETVTAREGEAPSPPTENEADKSRSADIASNGSDKSQSPDTCPDEELLELLRQPVYTRAPRNKNKHKNATTKLVRPIKDIPPRFKKLLEAEACAQAVALRKNQFEGAPLVRQTMMGRGRRHRTYEAKFLSPLDQSQVNFNPNAQCFVPGQPYQCPPAEQTSEGSYQCVPNLESSGSAASDPDTYVKTSCSVVASNSNTDTNNDASPTIATTTTPMYTLHLVQAPPTSVSSVGDGFYCECSNSGVCLTSTGSYTSQQAQQGLHPGAPPPPPPPMGMGVTMPQVNGTVYYPYMGAAPQQQPTAAQGPPPPPPAPAPQPYM